MEKILQGLASDGAILFLGSGFALDSSNIAGDLPGVAALREELLVSAGMAREDAKQSSDNLTDVADYCFEDESRRAAAVQTLRRLFSVSSIKEWQIKLLTAFPWKRIYTTNYDNSIELAFNSAGKSVTVHSGMSDFFRPQIEAGSGCAIHLNGVAASVTAAGVDQQIRLSGRSYALNDLQGSKWADLFATDVAHCDAAVFVGFSVSDLDIGRLILSFLSKKKTYFYNGAITSQPVIAKLQGFGEVRLKTGEELYAELSAASVGFSSARIDSSLMAFSEYKKLELSERASDQKRRELFIYGQVDDALLQRSSLERDSKSYLIQRYQDAEILTSLNDGKDVAVLSSLGNGKTILLKSVAVKLNEAGWRVFSLRDISAEWMKDVETICSIRQRVAVILDGATDCFRIVEAMALRRPSSLRFVLGERTRRYETRYTSEVLDDLGVGEIHEYDLDALVEEEMSDLDGLLMLTGLWGTLSARERSGRVKFIRKQCSGEIASTLLHVVQSKDVEKKVKEVLANDSFIRAELEILCAAVAMTVFGFRVPLPKLARLCGAASANQLLSKKTEFRDHLYSLVGGEFQSNSKVFGAYFLRKLVAPSIVLSGLSVAIKNALKQGITLNEEESADWDPDNRLGSRAASFPSPLYIFRNVQQAINVHDCYPEVFAFYETIKEKTKLSDNPLYWLQYALAKFFSGDLESAKECLDTAYGVAERTGFSPYQIDNQYARWLLESACVPGRSQDAFEAFSEAHAILAKQISGSIHAHYPFRVASSYRDFYIHHRHEMSSQQRTFVVSASAAIRDRIKYAVVETSKKRWLERCDRNLKQLEGLVAADMTTANDAS